MSGIITSNLNGTFKMGTTNINSPNDASFSRAFAKIISTTLSQSNTAENITITSGTPLTVTLPVSPANLVYVRNMPNSAAILSVSWTPAGGASVSVTTLTPGGILLLFETATGGGVTALSLATFSLTSTVEWIVAG